VLQSYAEYETTVLTVKLRGRRIVEFPGPPQKYLAQFCTLPAENHHRRHPRAALPGHMIFGLIGTDIIMLALLGKEREPGKRKCVCGNLEFGADLNPR
jgi:hypothetical protein